MVAKTWFLLPFVIAAILQKFNYYLKVSTNLDLFLMAYAGSKNKARVPHVRDSICKSLSVLPSGLT